MNQFRVIVHEPVCPDCGSRHITTSDIDTTDGLSETAHICATCGAAWPVACIAEDLAPMAGSTP
jgi:DNA-directed RNA polymerase subunit RPC12/RpoP